MKIIITDNPSDNTYSWEMWDGPDGIDHSHGLELDVGQCFEQIIAQRTLTALGYALDEPLDKVALSPDY